MMDKILCFGAILFSVSAFGQIEVPEVQKSLYGSVDATWCGNCGRDGIPTTASIYSQVNDKAVFFELHASTSSELYAPKAQTLSDEFGVSSYPSVTLNGVLQGPLNASIENQLVTDITNNYNATSTDVNAGFEWMVEGDSLFVTTNTAFFEELTGEFYTGVYITQDSIWEFQANYDPNIPNGDIYHFHILRDVLSDDVHGVPTGSGTIAADTEIMANHKMKIDPSWDLNNIHISTIVWQKEGSDFTFKNTNDIGEALTSNLSLEDVNVSAQISLFPNPGTDLVNLTTNDHILREVQITDNLGRIITVYNTLGISQMQLDVSQLNTGVYYIVGKTDNGRVFNKPFIKQ